MIKIWWYFSHEKVSNYPGKGIIDDWKELIGPTSVEEAKEKAPDSLRAQYGTKEMFNALHGSDSQQNAAKLVLIQFLKLCFVEDRGLLN